MVISGSVLVLTFWPVVRDDTKVMAVATVVTIVVLHTLLAIGCKVSEPRGCSLRYELYTFHLQQIVHFFSFLSDVLLPDSSTCTNCGPYNPPDSHNYGHQISLTNKKEWCLMFGVTCRYKTMYRHGWLRQCLLLPLCDFFCAPLMKCWDGCVCVCLFV